MNTHPHLSRCLLTCNTSALRPSSGVQGVPTATPLSQLIGKEKGCFDSAADIDAVIRAERDAWAR